jgi:predicted nucleic acid-binding protein
MLAKEKGLIPVIAPLIAQLQIAGLYLSQALIDKVLALAGET